MAKNTNTISNADLAHVTGGVTGWWLANHPYAAAGYLAAHPYREQAFAANHPFAFQRIERIQDRWGIG